MLGTEDGDMMETLRVAGVPTSPCVRALMKRMIRVQLGDEDVDVEQAAHGNQIPSSAMIRWICSVVTNSPREG